MSTRFTIRGAIHAHSNLSHDGTLSLEELRGFFVQNGFKFVCITEHSSDMDAGRFEQLCRRCQELSDTHFALIPGLEFSCDGELHILGIGVNSTTEESKPSRIIDHIHESGGLAILAHPTQKPYPLDSAWVRKLDGAELWNVRNDGKFLPQADSISMFRLLKKWNPRLLACFSIDFHSPAGFYPAGIEVRLNADTPGAIIESLQAGDFVCQSKWLTIDSSGQINTSKFVLLGACRTVLNLVRKIRDVVLAGIGRE